MSPEQNLNLIIPMVGQGKRFRKAGYEIYKPFIPINGTPMIKYVTDAFPSYVRKFVITNRELLTSDQEAYLEENLKCKIIEIPLHNLGPAYSIFQAREKLPLNESIFISYCDHYWSWNFTKVLEELYHDGIVFTHQGFHPHLVQNNYSAFCLPEPQNSKQLQEIKEKESFTENWMDEPMSVGVFYIKDGKEMMKGISAIINQDFRINNEFFPSLLFNYLIANKNNIYLADVDFYIHWGVPEQLQDFERWNKIIRYDTSFKPLTGEKYPETIVTMAGLGDRMKSVSSLPKALIPIMGTPMYKFVMEHFPTSSSMIITTSSIAERLINKSQNINVFKLRYQTRSQFDTLLAAINVLICRRNFFLISCDAYGIFDFQQFQSFLLLRNPDAVIFTFKPSLMHQKMSLHHSHVSVDEKSVIDVHVKAKSKPSDLGFAGFFWFRNGNIFNHIPNIPKLKHEEMIIDHVIKYFVNIGMDIAYYNISHYIHLGSQNELLEYRYWNDNKSFLFSKFKTHDAHSTFPYVGDELELFANANNWKKYYTKLISPYISGSRILEVGAGLGETTIHLCDNQEVENWVCLEPDSSMAEVISQKINNNLLPAFCEVINCIITDLDPTQQFQTILYIDVLEHIKDDKQELLNAAKHLANGGRLVVVSPANNMLFSSWDEAIGHYRRYNRNMLIDLTPEGLRCIKLAYIDSIGFFASLANKYILRKSNPTLKQILFWDSLLVPLSRIFDKLLFFNFGKNIIAVWEKP